MTITNKLIHSSLWQTQNKMSVRKFSIDSPCLIDDLIRSITQAYINSLSQRWPEQSRIS